MNLEFGVSSASSRRRADLASALVALAFLVVASNARADAFSASIALDTGPTFWSIKERSQDNFAAPFRTESRNRTGIGVGVRGFLGGTVSPRLAIGLALRLAYLDGSEWRPTPGISWSLDMIIG